MNNHGKFLQGIREVKLIEVVFNAEEKGKATRLCVPFDFGPSRRLANDKRDRYHFYDIDSPSGGHVLSILPEQLISVELTNTDFNPGDYVTWKPSWFVERDWGVFS